MSHPRASGLITIAAIAAIPVSCRPVVDIGSNVIWHANHESGDLSEWTADASGGTITPPPGVVAGVAHSGTYGVRLSLFNEVALWRQGKFPTDSYFSAWFYLPRAYDVSTSWTFMTFGSAAQADAARAEKTLLNMRTLPGGQTVLFIFDDRTPFLQSPLAASPTAVPVARWFQIEVFYRNANDDSGRLSVWLDGMRVYDFLNRPSGATPDMYWGVGNVPDVVTPRPEIYMDDAVISISRVTPQGTVGPLPTSTFDAAPQVD